MKSKKMRRYVIPALLLWVIVVIIGFLVTQNGWVNNNGESKRDVVFSPQMQFNNNLDSFLATDNPQIKQAFESIKTGDIKNAISQLEALKQSWEFSGENLSALNSLLITSYLTFGSVYYDESNNSIKARDLLQGGTISKETWFYNYYMGYSYEIENSFEQALAFYNEALLYGGKIWEAQSLNQIGHVYDLQGNLDEAYRYYTRAYNSNSSNLQINLNLGRAYTRKIELSKAQKYFEYVVDNTENKILKSEIYFNLSTLSFYSSWGLDDSLEFAQKSIKENPDYPFGYTGVARVLLEQWEASIDTKEHIDKALELYWDFSMAYRLLWIYYYMNNDFENSILSFSQYSETAQNDITLMASERSIHDAEAQYFKVRAYAQQSDADNSMKILQDLVESWEEQFVTQFLWDFSIDDGPFEKIQTQDIVIETLNNILVKYNK